MGHKETDCLKIEQMELYWFYHNRFVNVLQGRYVWGGLPKTCKARYAETVAIYEGRTAFLKAKETQEWYSLGIVPGNAIDLYGDPVTIKGQGANGVQYETDDWEMFYDNATKIPPIRWVRLYAKLLTSIHLTYQLNLYAQRNPFCVVVSGNQLLTVENFFRQYDDFKPVIKVKNTELIDDQIKVLQMEVPYKGRELLESLKVVWAEGLSMMGVSTETTKKERLNQRELTMNNMEATMIKNSGLLERMDCANRMRERPGWENVTVNFSGDETAEFQPYPGDLATMTMDLLDDEEGL